MISSNLKKGYLSLGLIFLAVSMTGCGANKPKPLYVWSDYVKTSTDVVTESHDEKSVAEHMAVLEKIFKESEEKGTRVAPGLYAEYAELLYQHRNKIEAKKYFILEKQTYPESAVFIDSVTTKLYGEAL